MLSPAHKSAITEGKAYRLLRANVSETLLGFSLTMPQWTMLGQVNDTPGIRLAELAGHVGVEAPLVTIIVRDLEEKKLLTSKADSTDNRAKVLYLTEEGERLLPEIERMVHGNLEPLMKGITMHALGVYFSVLETIVTNASNEGL
jgi:MarR family transcriptional regulator for hemolysin